jgi:hypothetical protein
MATEYDIRKVEDDKYAVYVRTVSWRKFSRWNADYASRAEAQDDIDRHLKDEKKREEEAQRRREAEQNTIAYHTKGCKDFDKAVEEMRQAVNVHLTKIIGGPDAENTSYMLERDPSPLTTYSFKFTRGWAADCSLYISMVEAKETAECSDGRVRFFKWKMEMGWGGTSRDILECIAAANLYKEVAEAAAAIHTYCDRQMIAKVKMNEVKEETSEIETSTL